MPELKPVPVGDALERGGQIALRFILIVAGLWVLSWGLLQIRLVVLPAVLALFLATLLVPPARWLQRRGLPRLAATWVVFVAYVGLLVGIGWLVVPPMIEEFNNLGQTMSDAVDRLDRWLGRGAFGLSGTDLSSLLERTREELRQNAGAIVRGVMSGTVFVAEIVAGFLLMLVLAFFYVKDGDRINEAFLSLAPRARRDDLRVVGAKAWSSVQGFLIGAAIVGVVDAVLIGIALFALGIPLLLPLMTLIFFGAFFPIVGALVTGAISALVALVTDGLTAALIITGVTIAVQQFEGDVVAPMIYKRTVYIHPVVVLLALTAGGALFGIVGAFFAVPVTSAVFSIVAYFRGADEAEA